MAHCSFYSLVTLIFFWANTSVYAESAASEYSVKAAYLLNFARYAEIQAEEAPKAERFHICTWKDNPFKDLTDELEQRQLSGLKVKVVAISQLDEVPTCRILFISEDNNVDLAKLFPHTFTSHVLTVTENQGSGILNFQVVDGQVRFDCNLEVAAKSHIKLSSQLIKLAVNVIGASP